MTQLIDRCRVRAESQEEREVKARELAGSLLETWAKEVSGAKGVTFYMHAAYHHLPEMIRSLPVDIIMASGDAFEAKNQQLKKMLRRHVSSRRSEVLADNCRRTNKRGHTKNVGSKRGQKSSSRSFQALRRELLLRWVQWHPIGDSSLEFVPPSAVNHRAKLEKKLVSGHKLKKLSKE